MKQLTINPNNRQYYSEDFIKGFECGTQRQLEADRSDVDRPQGEWIEVSTLREIFGDVQYAHRGNSEAEAVIADVWYEVKDVLKGADDE